MKHHSILRVVGKIVLPYILLFALYVQFHGDFGPGGGFQAGVILAAGVILYGMIHGPEAVRRALPQRVVEGLAALGVLIYGGVGVVALMRGGHYLEYGVLEHDPTHGQHLGILLVELGVGTTVASAMILIFLAFAERNRVR